MVVGDRHADGAIDRFTFVGEAFPQVAASADLVEQSADSLAVGPACRVSREVLGASDAVNVLQCLDEIGLQFKTAAKARASLRMLKSPKPEMPEDLVAGMESGGEKPRPWSATVICSHPSSSLTVIRACLAEACFTMFMSSSRTDWNSRHGLVLRQGEVICSELQGYLAGPAVHHLFRQPLQGHRQSEFFQNRRAELGHEGAGVGQGLIHHVLQLAQDLSQGRRHGLLLGLGQTDSAQCQKLRQIIVQFSRQMLPFPLSGEIQFGGERPQLFPGLDSSRVRSTTRCSRSEADRWRASSTCFRRVMS